MSEKYEPLQEEIEKAEEMAVEGEMTPEQEKMSEVRADAFEAGQHAILDLRANQLMRKKEDHEVRKVIKERDEMIDKIDLSEEAKKSFIESASYDYKSGKLWFHGLPKMQIMSEIIEKVLYISNYRLSGGYGEKELKFVEKIFDRFPNAMISNVDSICGEIGCGRKLVDDILKELEWQDIYEYKVHDHGAIVQKPKKFKFD